MSENACPNRIRANRANAHKSTEGKQRDRHNAVKHGLNTLRHFLRLQKNDKITTDLLNQGTPKNEETKPTFSPPPPPQTPELATTSDDSPILYDKTNFHDISD